MVITASRRPVYKINMRVSLFAILPIALALASTATATANYDHDFEARDYIDDLATRDYEDDSILGARHLLVDISTRDLVDELTRRRGLVKFKCKTCGAKFGKSGDEIKRKIALNLGAIYLDKANGSHLEDVEKAREYYYWIAAEFGADEHNKDSKLRGGSIEHSGSFAKGDSD
ncbi:hypothetical protein DFP72DRAFT_1051697 [Ephemerocybe angulata]|uniref:Uncharacterized protein n=1 Tax=Ephemerocybe angulata TaxID=980116 RepID=A0A8H6HEU3_9AGAR|nr:hypothetical protein DFP72DRAFT_1051697 [Tulosesus angulatus]